MSSINQAQLERERLIVVLATVFINIVGVIIFSFVPWSDWRTGLGLNLLDNSLLILYTLYRRDKMMAHLIVFGVILGFVELIADAWLVDVTRTLDYSIGGGPMLWRSPVWMPFAWEVVAVQFGYIGTRMIERWKNTGLLGAGIIGAINIPFYEEMALRTKWWSYSSCKMIFHTPYYIIVGEFLIVLAIALLARNIRKEQIIKTIFSGIVAGISIFVFYAAAYLLIDRIL